MQLEVQKSDIHTLEEKVKRLQKQQVHYEDNLSLVTRCADNTIDRSATTPSEPLESIMPCGALSSPMMRDHSAGSSHDRSFSLEAYQYGV